MIGPRRSSIRAERLPPEGYAPLALHTRSALGGRAGRAKLERTRTARVIARLVLVRRSFAASCDEAGSERRRSVMRDRRFCSMTPEGRPRRSPFVWSSMELEEVAMPRRADQHRSQPRRLAKEEAAPGRSRIEQTLVLIDDLGVEFEFMSIVTCHLKGETDTTSIRAEPIPRRKLRAGRARGALTPCAVRSKLRYRIRGPRQHQLGTTHVERPRAPEFASRPIYPTASIGPAAASRSAGRAWHLRARSGVDVGWDEIRGVSAGASSRNP